MIFIGYYDVYNSCTKRKYATSAVNKINYMLKMFSSCGMKIRFFSCSENIETSLKYVPSEHRIINENLDLYFPSSWGGKNKLLCRLQKYWMLISLFLFLLRYSKKSNYVVVYHATEYKNIIILAKKIVGFKLILDVEEIYSDVLEKDNDKMIKYEQKYFHAADAFLLSTILLEPKVNTNGKPFMVMNGTYELEQIVSEKFQDGKIHVVYAGTFDPRKGGLSAAVDSTKFLTSDYHLHICGFGTLQEVDNVKKMICDTQKKTFCHISFEGLLKGEDYIKFIQKCHIGLSTQNPKAKFNNTSFPSKILSYLSNGLEVVSIRIPAIETSSVGSSLYYYEEQEPSAIANAIMSVTKFSDKRNLILKLDQQAQSDFKLLINKLSNLNE